MCAARNVLSRDEKALANYRSADQIGFILRLAHQYANANLAAKTGDFDLTPAQASVLVRLHELGEASQNHLGRLVAMESANIRDVVVRLKSRQLITQRRHPTDGRLTILSLTAAGRTLVQQLIPLSIKSVSEVLAPLNQKERTVLQQLLKRIIEAPTQ